LKSVGKSFCRDKRIVRIILTVAKIEDTHVSTSEAAEILGVTRQRVLQVIQQGSLKATRLANVYLIKKSDLADVKDRKPGRPAKKKR
jgi:excisionase family DNA binding protein